MNKTQRWLLPLLALIVVIAVGVTVTVGIMFANASAEERARSSALDAAKSYVVDMFAWNPKNVDNNITTTLGRLTGPAKKDYQDRVVSEKVAELVKQQGVSTALTIQGAGVMENTRNTARVLLFVNQSSTRNDAAEVQIDSSRLVFGMEKQGDSWKINEIDILSDDSLEQNLQQTETPPSDAVPIPEAPASQSPAPAPGS